MGDITNLSEQFFISMSLGVGLFVFLIDTKAFGAGLLKLFSSICGASSFIALLIHLTYGAFSSPQSILYSIATIAFLLVYLFHEDDKSPFMWVLYAIQVVTLLLNTWLFHNENGLIYTYAMSSVLMLGSVTFSMVLGHWYLVNPRLTVEPLKKGIIVSAVVLIIKAIWTTGFAVQNPEFFDQGTSLGMGYIFNWIMFLMRFGWGYIVIGVMAYYAYRLAKMRSTQSATGVLYAMTIFVFIGELVSNYLYFHYGVLI